MLRHEISLSRQSFLPFRLVLCRDRILKCHNIKHSFLTPCRDSFLFSSLHLMSRHKISFSRQIFLSSALQICCNKFCYVATFFLWFFSTFVVTEFLTVVCCCCRDIYFLCCDIILLSCTTKSELFDPTDLENVATYFLP